ncbi:MAG: nucleoside 2-deoxyribosyltransferase domain-containing protein [Clostridia bacterium]|nr:nucleoside 2-deoxyribosyltransferase domain-containing protein [Clostridia bacterium]
MLLYFAGPLFCEAERAFNAKLTEQIETLGYKVFLPQRDGDQVNHEPYLSMTVEKRAKAIFDLDKEHLLSSDIFLYVLDGRIPDEGAAVALGMAHMKKKMDREEMILVGLHTDRRAAFPNEKLNPMIYSSLDVIYNNVDALLAYLEEKI